MKRLLSVIPVFITMSYSAFSQSYTPTNENITARRMFQDMKFGMFIHWGAFSVLGDGEWVMNNRKIPVKDYKRLIQFFNPIDFDAKKWVATAKDAGMKYITFISRHHDGFSNWDTKASEWKITNTPYSKDAFKQLADECHLQGIQLFVYYSLLDWGREDYPHETGRTGKTAGRTGHGDYAAYLQFMKCQLTELLSNYGQIAGVWFDGHWDQTAPEGSADRSSSIDWKYNEIYSLIHTLQPSCLIGNNHHLSPLPGEDFQMFERDLPGENKSGLSFQEASQQLPLETCETMNDSWGFNISDRNYKSVKQLIQYLVNAVGRNANFLLNIGPMPNGAIQTEFTDTLKGMGAWLHQYGESVYGTRGKIIEPQDWGVVTGKDKKLFVHVLHPKGQSYFFLPGIKSKVLNAVTMKDNKTVTFKQQPEGLFIYTNGISFNDTDTIVQLQVQ